MSSEETDILKMISIIYRKTQMYLNEQMAVFNLSGGLAPFLMTICENRRMVQNQIGEMLDISKGTVAKSLAKLEELKYIVRTTNGSDNRIFVVEPTPKALEIYPKLRQLGITWTQQISAGLTAEQQVQLFHLLDKSSRNACAYFDNRE